LDSRIGDNGRPRYCTGKVLTGQSSIDAMLYKCSSVHQMGETELFSRLHLRPD
jgi:hypothetical protein